MTTARGRVGVLVALACVAACSSDRGAVRRGSSSSAPLQSVLVQALSSTWTSRDDSTAGITFELPGAATRRDRSASGIVERIYTYPFTDQAAVSVGVADLPSVAKVKPFVDDYASTLGQEFRASGVTSFSVTERHSSSYAGHQAFDMRIVYLPIAGPRIAPVWFIRLVVVGTHVIVLQTVASRPSGDATFIDTCRTLQERLVGLLRFSPRTGA